MDQGSSGPPKFRWCMKVQIFFLLLVRKFYFGFFSVSVYTGAMIDSIKFFTDEESYGKCRGSGGGIQNSTHPSCRITYLSGKSAILIDVIRPHHECIAN